MPTAAHLTGAWAADDGATYYIRHLSDGSVTWAGLHSSGFHPGVAFTNVFRGRVWGDGTTLTGTWADVPRGDGAKSGTLSLEITQGPWWQAELRQNAGGTTGGFGATVWTSDFFGPFPQ